MIRAVRVQAAYKDAHTHTHNLSLSLSLSLSPSVYIYIHICIYVTYSIHMHGYEEGGLGVPFSGPSSNRTYIYIYIHIYLYIYICILYTVSTYMGIRRGIRRPLQGSLLKSCWRPLKPYSRNRILFYAAEFRAEVCQIKGFPTGRQTPLSIGSYFAH